MKVSWQGKEAPGGAARCPNHLGHATLTSALSTVLAGDHAPECQARSVPPAHQMPSSCCVGPQPLPNINTGAVGSLRPADTETGDPWSLTFLPQSLA